MVPLTAPVTTDHKSATVKSVRQLEYHICPIRPQTCSSHPRTIYLLKAYTGSFQAFHKFKSYTSCIKKHLTFNYMYMKTNIKKHCFKSKNSTFVIALVYNSNKAGTCWSNLSISVYKNIKNHPQTPGNQKRCMSKCINSKKNI